MVRRCRDLPKLPASLQNALRSAAAGVKLDEMPVLIGKRDWLCRLTSDDLLRRTSGRGEAYLMLANPSWHQLRERAEQDYLAELLCCAFQFCTGVECNAS